MVMKLQLIKGKFSQTEALDILTRMIHLKIKFHENKIEKSQNEEDIKMRERRIKQLQKEFYEAKKIILSGQKYCELESSFSINLQ